MARWYGTVAHSIAPGAPRGTMSLSTPSARPIHLLFVWLGFAALLLLGACAPASPSPTAVPAKPPEQKAAPAQPPTVQPAQPAVSPAEKAPATAAERLEALSKLPPAERRAALLEEARKERSVVWYTSYAIVEAEPYIGSFNKVYPDIKVEYFRASSGPLLDKLASEYRAGKHLVDVVMMDHEIFEDVKKAGVVGRYCSPERQAIPDYFKDKDCEWTAVYHNPKVIAYNTAKVPRDQAPKGWNDLLDPRWKGRLAIPADDGPRWIVTMEQIFGKEKGQEYVRKMAEQKVQLHESNSGAAQLIAAGDVDAGFYINVPAITNTRKSGAPIVSVSPDPLPTGINSVVIASRAQHPFAAALLIDYMLSKDGLQRMAEISTRFGSRADMTYPDQEVLQGVKLFLVTPEMVKGEAYEQARKQFKELFGQR